ncbi:MAG: DUF89 family protein [Bacteroidales bacterium]|nr:DUF89 family protein [Bacteroidales bacterium]
MIDKEKLSIENKNKFTMQMAELYSELINNNSFSAPAFSRELHLILQGYTLNPDPYKDIKRLSNEQVLQMYPELKNTIRNSANPFQTALRLAIAGNIIDFGIDNQYDLHTTINKVLTEQFAADDSQALHNEIAKAKTILYLGDNAGEIVFDKLFLELLKHPDVYFAVRNQPIINDATIEDAKYIGMDKIAKVISNGYDAPSTILKHCSDEFLEVFHRADVIISKGQGNLEGLLGKTDKNIFYLLMVKCDVIANALGVKRGEFVVKRNKLKFMKIAIASGKGGTGKTLVSTNLFWAAQKQGYPVTLVDCDAEEPNVAEFLGGQETFGITVSQNIPVINADDCSFCGKCHQYCAYNAIVLLPPARFIQVVEELCHDCGACLVACEFNAIKEKKKITGRITGMVYNTHAELIEARAEIGVYSPVPVIKKAIAETINHDLAILDSPPGISCPFIATVVDADFVALVTEPTPFGLNDLKLSAETLQVMGKPFGVIINRAGLGNEDVFDWLKEKKIPLLMEIPFDKEIAEIYSRGGLIAELSPKYREQFTELLKRIVSNANK